MKYDFISIIDRHGKDATAIDTIGKNKRWGNEPDEPKDGFDFIPMWVADMNFATCPKIPEKIIERAKHPLYGYFFATDEYYDSIINWQTHRNHYVDLKKEYIAYQNGVHGAITSAVNVLTQPGDGILIHSPLYTGFFTDIDYIGRTCVFSELKKDAKGIYRMDYEDMDRKIKENNIHTVILCSPHNPCGRVWERWELEKAMKVFETNDCFVISDEIWADITYSNHQHIPSPMVNDWARERTIAIYAPSKTFNMAGLVGSYNIIYGKYLRDRIDTYASKTNYNEMNVLSMHALIGAYSDEGQEWTDELREVLENNCRYVCRFINEQIDGAEVTLPEGTYMIFVDCSEYCNKTGKTLEEVLKSGWNVGVGWQNGKNFRGPCHIRMNLASPFSRIQEACERLKKYVFI